jgi:hypothetical protein
MILSWWPLTPIYDPFVHFLREVYERLWRPNQRLERCVLPGRYRCDACICELFYYLRLEEYKSPHRSGFLHYIHLPARIEENFGRWSGGNKTSKVRRSPSFELYPASYRKIKNIYCYPWFSVRIAQWNSSLVRAAGLDVMGDGSWLLDYYKLYI